MASRDLEEPEIAPEERQQVARGYMLRGDRFRRNFDDMVTEGAFDKASECLWGWFSTYTNALAILRSGRRVWTHGATVEYAQALALEFQDPESSKAINDANNMHRNFYHGGPVSRDDFVDPLAHITRYVQMVDQRLRDEASQGPKTGASMPPRRRPRRRNSS